MQIGLGTISALFAWPNHYVIPKSQRNYVWDQENHWQPLWEQVEELANTDDFYDDDPYHFMGIIVLQNLFIPPKGLAVYKVIDGQQRLITFQLLIRAVHDVVTERKYHEPTRKIIQSLHNTVEARGKKPRHVFKVWPTPADREAFRHVMDGESPSALFADSSIARAYAYFRDRACEWFDANIRSGGSSYWAVECLVRSFYNSVAVAVLEMDDSFDPNPVAATLNARGTPLYQSELVKNNILYRARQRRRPYTEVEGDGGYSSRSQILWPFDKKPKWWMEKVKHGGQLMPRCDLYLNHWLTLRTCSETEAHGEFQAFQIYASNQGKAGMPIRNVARDIREMAGIYREMEEEQRVRHPEGLDISAFLQRRKILDSDATTPLLLWLLSVYLPRSKLERCLKALESFVVRRALCGCRAESHGSFFAELIAKLDSEDLDRTDSVILSHLNDQSASAAIWPSDKDLLDKFLFDPLCDWMSQDRLRMVLWAIEIGLRTGKADTSGDSDKLRIEHLMPREWRGNWSVPEGDAGEEGRDRMIRTIGNLTLANGSLDSLPPGSPQSKKWKELRNDGSLQLNAHLVNNWPAEWNETTIRDRSRWMHAEAVKLWPHYEGLLQV